MADLVTRLRLDDKQFNDNIRKSKQELNNFKNAGKNAGDTLKNVLGNAIGKVAVPLTVATTAMKGFEEVMKSSQRNADFLDTEIYGLKQTVDEFFYSLGNGNLKSFLNDLGGLIDRSKQAYQALDQLGNTQISYGVVSSKNQASIAEAQYVAKNKFASNDERSAAFSQWKKAIESEIQGVNQYQSDLVKYVTSAVASKSSANIKVTLDDVMKAFEVDLSNPTLRANRKKQAEYGYNNWETNNARKDWTQEQKDALAEQQKQNIIIHTMLQKYTDEELKDIAEKVKSYYTLINSVKNLGREYNETATEYNNANAKMEGFKPVESLEGYKVFTGNTTTTTTTVTVKTIIPSGSIAELEKKIQETKANLNIAVDKESRIKLYNELKELEEKKRVIEFQYKYPTAPTGEIKSPSLTSMAQVPDFKNVKIGDATKNINKEAKKGVKSLDAYCSALNACSAAISNFNTTKFEDDGEGWTQWSANVLASIGATIPAIMALCEAEGVKSAFALPFPANLAAAATVMAAVISMFASLPTFADGGIFQSYLTTGDKNLARLNGGEMILNKGQQANLFNLLDKGTPLNNSGNVKFTIEGKQLVGVLNNYNNKRSKAL